MTNNGGCAVAAGRAPLIAATDHRLVVGIGCMVAGVSLIPLMDGIAKLLAADYHVLQIVWARFAFHLLWLVPVLAWRFPPRDLVARHAGLQLLRGALVLGATLC